MSNEELIMEYLKNKKIELLEERIRNSKYKLVRVKIDAELDIINDVMGFIRVGLNGEEQTAQ